MQLPKPPPANQKQVKEEAWNILIFKEDHLFLFSVTKLTTIADRYLRLMFRWYMLRTNIQALGFQSSVPIVLNLFNIQLQNTHLSIQSLMRPSLYSQYFYKKIRPILAVVNPPFLSQDHHADPHMNIYCQNPFRSSHKLACTKILAW